MSRQTSDLIAASNSAIRREAETLPLRIARLEERVATHSSLLERLYAELEHERRILREIQELTDKSAQLRLERLDRELKGQRIQEVAVEILRRRRGKDVVHYREWFALVRDEGFDVAGRDPLNTFLTGIGRAETVERVGNRSGLYRLKVA